MSTDAQSQYANEVYARSVALCELKIWHPVSAQRLENWWDQFEADEKLLAAVILDQLVVRSRAQVSALIDDLMLKCSRHLIHSEVGDDRQLISRLSSRRIDPLIKLAPVIGLDTPPTKSGPYILRLLQRRHRVLNRHLVWPFPDKLKDLRKR